MDTFHFRDVFAQMQKALECSICLELLNNPVSTKCDHQFCRFCIIKFLESKRSVPCPLCKVPVTKRSLQERSELSVVISNVQKLIAAYDRDTGLGQQAMLESTSENGSAGTSSKQNTVDKTQAESVTQTHSVNDDQLYDHDNKLVPKNGSKEQLHRNQLFGTVTSSKPRARLKPDSLALNDASIEGLPRKRLKTGNMSEVKTSKNSRISVRRGTNIFETASSENEDVKSQNLKTEEGNLLCEKGRVEPSDSEHRQDINNEDLLNYLEIGSCGAVFDDCPVNKDCKEEESICGDLRTNVNKNRMANSNDEHEHTNRNQQRENKLKHCEKDDIAPEPADSNNKKVFRRCTRKRLPLSPSKSNVSESSPGVNVDNLSKFDHYVPCQDSESKENVTLVKDAGSHIKLGSEDICDNSEEVSSPVSSLSSTQQLSKPKPVTARTYSRDMRKAFNSGFVKNWADTLPDHSGGQTELNQNRGLTTKEKINAKRQTRQNGQPPKSPQADAHYGNADKCLNITETVGCNKDLVKLNDSLQVQFDLPLTPVPRRRSIFKSHVQTSGIGATESDSKIPPNEDPYEFTVGQTPVKSKKKIVGRRCEQRSQASTGNEATKGQERNKKLRRNKVTAKKMLPLDVFLSDKPPLLDGCNQDEPKTVIGNTALDIRCNVSDETPDKKEAAHPHAPITNTQRKSKMVHFSLDVDRINIDSRSSERTKEDHIEAENTAAVQTSKTDIGGKATNHNHSRLSHSESVHLSGAQEESKQSTRTISTVPQKIPETSSMVINNFEYSQHSVKFGETASRNSENQVCGDIEDQQSFVDGTHLELLQICSNQQVKEAHHGENGKSLPLQSKRMQKRKYKTKCARQKECVEAVTFSQKAGKEMTKLIDKINEAEDHELMFNTQDVQQKLEEDLQKEQLLSEAFGFDLLDSNNSNVTDAQKTLECETSKFSSTCEQNLTHDQMNSSHVNDEKVFMNKDVNNSVVEEESRLETNLLQKTMGNVEKEELKTVDFVEDTPGTAKNSDTLVKGNIILGENLNPVNRVAEDVEGSVHDFSNVQQPKQNISLLSNKHCPGSAYRRKFQHFPRPNISEMILVSPSAKLTPAGTAPFGSSSLESSVLVATNNRGLESSVLDGKPYKVPIAPNSVGLKLVSSVLDNRHQMVSTVENVCEAPQMLQYGDYSKPTFKSDIAVEGDIIEEHNSNQQDTPDLHSLYCTQNMPRYSHSLKDIEETLEPLHCHPVISATNNKKTVVNPEEKRVRKVSLSAQLSLKSKNSLKSNTVSSISHERINDALDGDVILAPDTCAHSRGAVVADGGECLENNTDCVVLETLDFEASNHESATQLKINSSLNDSRKAEITSGSLGPNRAGEEVIVETQCLSDQSTVSFAAEAVEIVPQRCVDKVYTSDLSGGCHTTETECPSAGILINLDTSHNKKVQSLAIAETSQETISGSSSQSQFILLPADKKSPVTSNDSPIHPVDSPSQQQTQFPMKQQLTTNNMSPNEPVPETPHATISPKQYVSSAPDRLINYSGSEDEDHVLIVRRPKRKCFSLNGSPLKPVVFGGGTKNLEGKLSVLFTGAIGKQSTVGMDYQPNIENKNHSTICEPYAEMIGETEAMDVIDTFTETERDLSVILSGNLICEGLQNQVKQDESVLEVGTGETPAKELEPIYEHCPDHLVEVTPVGKFKYINSSGKYVVDFNDVYPNLQSKRKSQKCLFSTTSKSHLTRSAAKRKREADSHHQDTKISSVKLNDGRSPSSSKTRDSTCNKLSATETDSPHNFDNDPCVDLTNNTKEIVADTCESQTIEKSYTDLSNVNLSSASGEGRHTKRGLARKGNINLDSSVIHPRRCLSPTSKEAIRRGIEKASSVFSPRTGRGLGAPKNSVDVIDVDAEFEIRQAPDEQNKIDQSKSTTGSDCASSDKVPDSVRCSQASDSEIIFVEAKNLSRKNKRPLTEVNTKKEKRSNLAEPQQEYEDEKKRLEKELFGMEKKNKNSAVLELQLDNTKSGCKKNSEKVAQVTGSHPLSLEDDDSELLFDLGDSTDDEAANESKRSVKNKGSVKTTIIIDEKESAVQSGESIKSSGSLYLTSSPLEKVDNIEPTNMNQTAISAIDETDVEEEDDVYMVPKTRVKRNQIISDSDDSEQEDIQDKSPTNNTSSSAFSSQSEIITTEQQEALEKDVARLHQQIAEYEAKLGKLNTNVRLNEANQEKDNSKMSTVAGSDESLVIVSHVADHDEDSNDLFLSPLSPSPPSRQANPKPVNRRPALSNCKRPTDQYMKQFQSPGGTVRTKKSLEFTVSSTISEIENKNTLPTKSVTEPSPLEPNLKPGLKTDTGKQLTDVALPDAASSDNVSTKAEGVNEIIDGQRTPEKKHNFSPPVSPIILSQKTRHMGSQNKKRDNEGLVSCTRSQPEKDLCLVASGLGRDEHLMVMKLVDKCKLKFSSKFSKEVTHVVMKPAQGYDRVCDRTLKFFQGVAHKCWVVAFLWVADSIQAGFLLPEENYEILGDTSGGESNLGVKRSRLCQDNLFKDFCFACVGDSNEMPKESLHDLLAACGAVIVDDPISLISKVAKYKLIIRCSDSDVAPSTSELDVFNGLHKHMALLTVMREWVLDSLGSYKLQPLVDYVINTDANIGFPF